MPVVRVLAVFVTCVILLSLGQPDSQQPAVAGSALMPAAAVLSAEVESPPLAARRPADPGVDRLTSPLRVRYRWPVDGPPVVIRRFEPPPQRWLPGHRGLDLDGVPGQRVLAAGAGNVHYVGRIAGVGVVSVLHADGLLTTYQPVRSHLLQGASVAAGDLLGVLEAGHPGCRLACLHWGLRHADRYLDPTALLGRVRVRLLPVRGR